VSYGHEIIKINSIIRPVLDDSEETISKNVKRATIFCISLIFITSILKEDRVIRF
jgi:hypothetical protein